MLILMPRIFCFECKQYLEFEFVENETFILVKHHEYRCENSNKKFKVYISKFDVDAIQIGE